MLRSELWRACFARAGFMRFRLREDRRGAVVIMFALALIPLILAVSLAIDYGFAVQARAQLNLAADAAAMQAVRVASQSLNAGATVAASTAAGVNAGQQWWAAQLGTLTTASVPSTGVDVALTYTPSPGTYSATVTYTGTITTKLGLTSVIPTSWTIAGTASALVTNSYLEVLMMLDNSSSMQIGAGPTDIATMMQITPCSSIGEWTSAAKAAYNATGTKPSPTDPYPLYQCTASGASYSGTPACPLAGYPLRTLNWVSAKSGAGIAESDSAATVGPNCPTKSADGTYPTMGAPCAFACHFDNTKPAGTGNDFYALARSTIGKANHVTLRFDVLKNATNALLGTMAESYAKGANLSVGIYTFNSSLIQVYPAAGEAGTDFAAAVGAVGFPPTAPNQPDTGIQPETLVGSAVHSDTYFDATMKQLSSKVTPSGDGTTAATPAKVLFIITDGVQDNCTAGACPGVITTTSCQNFKDMGFTVYVIYTQYYGLMHFAYLNAGMVPLTQGTGPGSVSYQLQQCASSPSDFAEATNLGDILSTLVNFLNTSLDGPSRITN